MKICALNEEFEIIYVKQPEDTYEILQCETAESKEPYTILHFTEGLYLRTLLPVFFSLNDNMAYEDYKGCFVEDLDLYIAFHQRGGIPVTELIQENALSLEERIQIGKRVLEKLLLWNLPEFVVCRLLDIEHIRLLNGEVVFDYEWQLPWEMEADQVLADKRAAELMKRLFEREIKYSISPGLVELTAYLEQGKAEDIFAIYEEYCSLADVLPKEALEYVPKTRRLRQRLLQKVNKMLGLGKILLAAAVYAGIIWLLVQEIEEQQRGQEEVQGVVFEKIGNLTIR